MFSHVARELGAHQCIGSRASDPASELQDLGGARVIATRPANCRTWVGRGSSRPPPLMPRCPFQPKRFPVQSKRKEPNGPCLFPPCLWAVQWPIGSSVGWFSRHWVVASAGTSPLDSIRL